MGSSILLVDDSSDIRQLVGTALEFAGYDVSTAEDGQKALDFFARTPKDRYPVVVVLDIMMPNVKGYGVLEGLSRIGYNGKVAIFSAVEKEDRAKLAGYPLVSAVIKKPSDIKTILDTIGGLIGESGDQDVPKEGTL